MGRVEVAGLGLVVLRMRGHLIAGDEPFLYLLVVITVAQMTFSILPRRTSTNKVLGRRPLILRLLLL